MIKRNDWLDGLKFILIALVVFGHSKHFLSIDSSAFGMGIVRYAMHTVYFFHMPLFIMISGYFSKKESDIRNFSRSTFRLLRIFLVFHFLWTGIDLLRGEDIDVLSPAFTLWYLLSLVYWRLILQCLPNRFLQKTSVVLSISFALCLLGGFVPLSNELSIQRTFTFLPCFFLGYYAKRHGWLEKVKNMNLFVLIAVALVLIFVENRIHLDYYGRGIYQQPLDVGKRVFFVCSSVILSMAFIRCMPKRISYFGEEGRDVLFFYIYHSFVLLLVSWGIDSLHLPLNGITVITIALLTIILLWLARKSKYLYTIMKYPFR